MIASALSRPTSKQRERQNETQETDALFQEVMRISREKQKQIRLGVLFGRYSMMRFAED